MDTISIIIAIGSLLYQVTKDAITEYKTSQDLNKYKEDKKLVNGDFVKNYFPESDQSSFSWSNPEKVENRLWKKTHEIVYTIDEQKKIKYKLVNKSGAILLSRKKF